MDKFTLKQWRLIKGKTIEDMATACGVHPNTYAAWEKDPGRVRVDEAMKIARTLDVDIETIFFKAEATKCSVV